jgi:hypothetical protein
MPLVIVFGAFRRLDIDPPLPREDVETITRVVGMARRMHIPLAFIRHVPQDRRHEPGAWLPGCRPRTTDRVFDHPAGAAFRLDAFASPFNGLTDGEIHVAGPANDSCLSAAIAAPQGDLGPIRRISANLALHKCSTQNPDQGLPFPPGSQSAKAMPLSLETWERAVCEVK